MENTEVIELLKDAFELKRQEKYKQAMELLYKALTIHPENVEILVQVAELHLLLNNSSSAGSIYERLLEKRPDDILVFEKLVSYYVNSLNYDKAKLILSKFILSYPSVSSYSVYFSSLFKMNENNLIVDVYKENKLENYHSALINKYYGFALCNIKKYDEALVVLKPLAENDLIDEDIQYYYAEALYNLNYKEMAYDVLLPFLNTTKNSKIYNLCGEIDLNNNKFEKAIALFSLAVKYKYNGFYFYNLGTAYFLNGQLEEAKFFYTQAISASPEVDEYRYAQAYLYYKQGELNKSQQILKELVLRNPNFKEAVLLLVELYVLENKFYLAEKELVSLNIPNKDEDEQYLKLAVKVASALYKKDLAIAYQEKLVSLFNENIDYKYELSRLYFDNEKYEAAARFVVGVIAENPKYVNVYLLAAKIYLKMFDFEKSISLANRALSLDLNNEEAFYLKALCFMGQQKFQESIETAKLLLDYNPHKAEAYALIASCFSELGDYESSFKFYNEALLLDEKNSDYFLNIAIIMQKMNNIKDSLRYLYVAHTLSPDNKDIKSRLILGYIEATHYKQAIKLLKDELKITKELEIKKEVLQKIKEVDNIYKQSVNIFEYIAWKIFGI